MDNKIDWSLAPEGATHKDASCTDGFWYKFDFDSDTACYWSRGSWSPEIPAHKYNDGSMDEMVARRKQWSGPQDGLPPVGTICELSYFGCAQGKVEILFISAQTTVCRNLEDNREQFAETHEYEFTPIKSPEQIAHELRESKIIEMMNIAGVDCKVTAGKLVDAGYHL